MYFKTKNMKKQICCIFLPLCALLKFGHIKNTEPDGENILKIVTALCNISSITFAAFFFPTLYQNQEFLQLKWSTL